MRLHRTLLRRPRWRRPAAGLRALEETNHGEPPVANDRGCLSTSCRRSSVPEFLFQCPNSGLTVTGVAPDETLVSNNECWIEMECHICDRTHVVNPRSGEVQDEEC